MFMLNRIRQLVAKHLNQATQYFSTWELYCHILNTFEPELQRTRHKYFYLWKVKLNWIVIEQINQGSKQRGSTEAQNSIKCNLKEIESKLNEAWKIKTKIIASAKK